MVDEPIIRELQRQLDLALRDLHSVFTNDVDSVDIAYYNQTLIAIDELNDKLNKIQAEWKNRNLSMQVRLAEIEQLNADGYEPNAQYFNLDHYRYAGLSLQTSEESND